jgi:hypothetical protein
MNGVLRELKALRHTIVGIATLLTVAGCLTSAGCVATTGQTHTPIQASAQLFRDHVSYLASDELLGREPGTPGYDAAAQYVADAFQDLGLEPGGTNGSYYQQVPLRRGVRDKTSISLSVIDKRGNTLDLTENLDYAVRGSVRNANVNIHAPLVFVGYGVVVASEDRDDYKEHDLNGKVAMMLRNTPQYLQSEERAYYGAQKNRQASERGAIGAAYLTTPTAEAVFPFARMIESGVLDSPSMAWLKPDGEVFTQSPNLRGGAIFSIAGAKKILAHSGHDWDAIINASEQGDGITPTFDTGLTINIVVHSEVDDIQSPNVVGVISGTDPELKHQVMTLRLNTSLMLSKT